MIAVKSFSAPLVVLLAVTSACGSRTTTTRHSTSRGDANAGPANILAMRALVEQYSPASYDIVTTYEALPTVYVFGTTTTTLSHSGGFADYFDDGAPQNLVDYMSTSVHEVYHAYASVMAYQLMQDGQVPRGLGAQAALLDEAPMLVTYTATYPASDMDSTFPADARTSRYEIYVSPSNPTQSTQQEGVYGLLDELTAYYHGSRVRVDFWPWVRAAAPIDEQLLVNYIARFHEMWVPYAEFKLYILHYLLHARDHHPAVYKDLLANTSFRRAFHATDTAYAALLATAADLEPTIHAFARTHNLDANLSAGQLTFDGSPFTIRDSNYHLLLAHLESPRYQEILADLR